MIGAKFILGILVGFFVVPAMIIDPVATFETAKEIGGKIFEVFTYIGGVAEVVTN
ncbi:MAG: hypothetical protein KJI69_03515 [Patescibacteria group bacterium]|nr:hypothetical protein [Patescibacteria group bacterium]